ncbi:class I SAM-dependent methyltransferase [Magnetospirillum fulvum]|uniref:Methyltransferase domain-containing protein n=1 Tax=Magnetospirillum fulvum TaxID=1082 RepID=A0A1H6H7W4_MAGFU|nr:class I SAM-dependent methyltransferase [Magnetospirillum fulvum]SEH30285.1 Methyltransferase domain-containing protein [Magnetospirillum fulvum]
MNQELLFDQSYYLEINEARWQTAQNILGGLSGIATCLDVGCGPGWFTDKLAQRGLKVVGVEGRAELVEVAAQRVPAAMFANVDVTDTKAMGSLPKADLVFCFGLLYHLENPFAAVRSLHALTGKHLLIETQLIPEETPSFRLVAEGQNETQGLRFFAVIPSRSALVKMLYAVGFACVERYTGHIEYPDFIDTPERIHRREVFLAGQRAMSLPDFVVEAEPSAPKVDYSR